MNPAPPERTPPGTAGGWPAGLPLEADRLLLRPFRESDFADVHEYQSDPEVVRLLRWGPNTPPQTRSFLRRAITGTRAPDTSRPSSGRVPGFAED